MPESVTLTTRSLPLQMGGTGDGAGVSKFDGVGDEVDDHLNEPVLIAGDRGQVGLDVANEVSFLASNSEAVAATARSMTSATETLAMFQVNLPASILARSSTSSMSLVRRSPSLTTTSRFSMTWRLGLLHLAVVFGDQREEALFKAAANDFGEAQHRCERGAQLVADGGKEGALGGIGFFGGGAGLARLFKEPGVMEGHADGGGDGGEQALIGFSEAAFLIGGLHADDADDLSAGGDGHAEVGSGLAAHLLDAQLGAVAVHILVDEQRLAGADDLRSEPDAEGPRLGVFAVACTGTASIMVARSSSDDVGDRRVEQVAHLVANKLDEAIFVELRRKRLGDAVDGDEFGGALADFVLLLD